MFNSLESLPTDPILGLMATFREDPNPNKIDLSVGVFKDIDGQTPIFKAVKEAEAHRLATEETKAYIGMVGTPGFNSAMQKLLFGVGHPVLASGRLTSAMSPGGCGALRVAAEFIARANKDATIWVSDPTWANHVPLIGGVGFELKSYPYYDTSTRGVNFEAMADQLRKLGPTDVVLLHGSCHNPTGADLTPEQWDVIVEIAVERGFLPFVDSAYQGLGDSLEADAYGIRKLAGAVPEMIMAISCSKNFGLYRDRVGLVGVLSENAERSAVATAQISSIARGMYSMPPAHGGAIVEHILTTPELDAMWRNELTDMCASIQNSRSLLRSGMENAGLDGDFSYLTENKGMFSYIDVTPEQVTKLREDHSVYLVNSGRVSIAGVTARNINYLVEALKAVS